MCRCKPTKAVWAYQWLSCEKQVYCRPPLMATIFPKNEIPHELLCDIFQDGGLMSQKKPKMMFQR